MAQKKRLDALSATQKTSALHKIAFLGKSRITAKIPFFSVFQFLAFFFVGLIFRNIMPKIKLSSVDKNSTLSNQN